MTELTDADSAPGRAAARAAAFQSTLSQEERALLQGASSVASALLATHGHSERVLRVAEQAMAAAQERSQYHLNVVRSEASVACRAGCPWCCHLKVSVTAPEVFAITQFLTEQAPVAELERTRSRVAELAVDPRIFCSDAKAEARIPCALLSERGDCSVHAVRPLSCRGYTSFDAGVCRRMLDDDSERVPMHDGLARDTAALSLGLLAGIGEAGLGPELLELTSALHIALSEPRSMQRWLAGEPIFAEAHSVR